MPAAKPPEFRRRAVDLARSGDQPVANIAADLGISESCLRRWMAVEDVDAGRREGLTSSERRELVELRRANRVQAMEIEILKRASAYFARENVPQNTDPAGPRAGSTRHRRHGDLQGVGHLPLRVLRGGVPAAIGTCDQRHRADRHDRAGPRDVTTLLRRAAGPRRAPTRSRDPRRAQARCPPHAYRGPGRDQPPPQAWAAPAAPRAA